MRNLLSQESRITKLSRNEKLKPDCLYILSSESISKTLYFESKKDILFAHKLISRHLRNVLDVVSYLFTPDGWVLLVRVKGEVEVVQYLERKRRKRKGYRFDVSREISEHIRYMISGLAKAINARTGRKGTLVSRTFSRYICGDVEIARQVIEKLENSEYSLRRQKRRYRASLRYWDVEGAFQSRASVFLNSKGRGRGMENAVEGLILLTLSTITKNVLHRSLNKAIISHIRPKTSKNTPISSLKNSFLK